MHESLQLLGKDKPTVTIGDIKALQDEVVMLNANLDRKADALENVSYTDSIQFI